MLRVTVEADVAGIDLQGRAKCEFCVPAVSMNGESYRLAQSKRRRRTASSFVEPQPSAAP